MLLLPVYFEEVDESFTNPDAEWYLGNDIVCNLPKISDYIGKLPEQHKKMILSYLLSGKVVTVGMSENIKYDGTLIHGLLYSDGKYIWGDEHIHYVEKYSLDLPKVFKDHILSFSGEFTDEQKRRG